MADIRIKDLATLESASLTGDVFVIDGTTGTRKLSAFSPSFGGNATVTGTLTVNSTSTFTGNATFSGSTLWLNDGGGGTFNFVNGSTVANTLRLGIGNTNQVLITDTKTSILATTASTTTSTGALVVGNGTSGGLGVGGAINAGGNIVLSPASVAASGEVGNLRIADSSNTNRKLFFGLDNTVSPNGVGYIQSTLTGTTTIPLQLQPLGGSLSVGNSGTVVTLNGTTASTTTSSGALVVSGGVGVAGAGYFGGTVTIASNFSIASTGFYAGGGTPGAGRFLYSATAGTMLCAQTGSSYDLSLASATGTVILGNPTGTSNLEAAGSIKTAAPSGGTAANWKLGTVATVSPTSPNRTIEVDIGGTIYYIHAKTTNN